MHPTVMIIDDDEINQIMMEFMINGFNCEAVTALNGIEGLDLARARAPGIIFCDIQMPVLNGYQTLARLRADPVLAAIPMIAMTAHAMVGDRERILAAGFDGYISKPFELNEIGRQLHAHLPVRTPSVPRRYQRLSASTHALNRA